MLLICGSLTQVLVYLSGPSLFNRRDWLGPLANAAYAAFDSYVEGMVLAFSTSDMDGR